jgi:hypothetical protein
MASMPIGEHFRNDKTDRPEAIEKEEEADMTGKALTKAEKAYVRTETRLAIVGAIVRLFEELEATSQPYLGEQDIANMHASYCQHACFIR